MATLGATQSTVDIAGSTSSSYPSSWLNMYVDYANGLDANNGLAPSSAKKTIQAAYNALKTAATGLYTPDAADNLGVGRITCSPGTHDVGTGVVFTRGRPVEVHGTVSGKRAPHGTYPSATRIVSSSSAVVSFFDCNADASPSAVNYGFSFQRLGFVLDKAVNTSCAQIIRCTSLDAGEVEHCEFDTLDRTDTTNVRAILHGGTSTAYDNAWFRVRRNDCRRMCLYECRNINVNRCEVSHNLIFYDGNGTLPMIYLNGDFFCSEVANNNTEGGATGIKTVGDATGQRCDKNVFMSNGGEESGTADRPLYDFTNGSQHNIIVGGGFILTGAGAGINGTFARFDTTSHSNIVINPQVSTAGFAGWKQKFVDNATLKNRLINASGTSVYYEAAASPTITDGDFGGPTPENGMTAVTHNTGSGESRLWVRANGTWKSVVVS